MNFLKWLSIRTQLFILAIATGVVVVLIILIIYFQVTHVIAKNNDTYTNELIFRIKQSISNKTDLMNRLLTGVAYNSVVQDYLLETDPYKKAELFTKVNNVMLNMQGINEGIIDIVFLSDLGTSYFLKGKKENVQNVMESYKGNTINQYTEMQHLMYGENGLNGRNCFMVISTVYSIDKNRNIGEKIGTAAIVFDAKELGLEINNKEKDSFIQFYLLDRKEVVYSGNDRIMLNKKFDISIVSDGIGQSANNSRLKNEKFIIKKEDIPEIGGEIISIIPQKKLFENLSWIRQLVITILIISGVLLLILFTIIINNILFPLRVLMSFIAMVKTGDLQGLKQRINLSGYVEMGVVAGKFNGMLDEVDHLTHRLINTSSRLYETELGKKQSELAFLRSQINPHFLYNTLETLKGMALDEGATKTMGMAKALAQIFRYTVKGTDIVSLQEELIIIKSYVQIQQIRFGDRFDVIYDFSDSIMEHRLPKMLLQPLVENAVCHGLEEKLEKGHLWIGGKLDEANHLKIWVKDDGMGISQEVMGHITASLSGAYSVSHLEKSSNDNIGIANVHNRIQLIYGLQFGIEINSIQSHGTEIIITIPTEGVTHV